MGNDGFTARMREFLELRDKMTLKDTIAERGWGGFFGSGRGRGHLMIAARAILNANMVATISAERRCQPAPAYNEIDILRKID